MKIRDRETLKSKCCWSCQRCNKTEIAVGSTCIELPKRYLCISANPNDPFIGALLFLSVFGLSLTLFVVVVFIKFNGNKNCESLWKRFMLYDTNWYCNIFYKSILVFSKADHHCVHFSCYLIWHCILRGMLPCF